MCVRVLRQNRPYSISQLKQVLCVLPALTGGVDDLVGYLLQRGGAEVVRIVVRADVEQRLVGRGGEWWTGVKGHRDGLVTTFFSVVEVGLHFLLPARRQLVGDAPNAPLRRTSDRRKTGSRCCKKYHSKVLHYSSSTLEKLSNITCLAVPSVAL